MRIISPDSMARAAGLILTVMLRLTPAHEARPVLLELNEAPDHTWEALWKQPRRGEMAVRLVPRLSNGWLDGVPLILDANPAFAIKLWRGLGPGDPEGANLFIEGLGNTLSGALVRVNRADGTKLRWNLPSNRPRLTLSAREALRPGRNGIRDRREPLGLACLELSLVLAAARIARAARPAGRDSVKPPGALALRLGGYAVGAPAAAAFASTVTSMLL